MVASGARPVLAGRDRGRLDAVAARLSQVADGAKLETAVAGTEGPGPLRGLLDAGDVLVSTARGVRPAGALGPVEAFGLDSLESACGNAGFPREPRR
jgi:hypothetical protein